MKSFYITLLLLICSSSSLFSQYGEIIRPLDFISQIQDVYVDDNGVGWAGGTCNTLLKTVNDGELWEQVTSPFEGNIRTLLCAPSGCQNLVLLFDDQQQVARSTDNGNSWEISSIETFQYVDRADALSDDIIIGQNTGTEMIRSTDGGLSWSAINFEESTSTTFSFPSNNTGFVFDNAYRMLKSTDAAATWTQTGYVHTERVRKISFFSENGGYLVDQNRHLYKTTDGGTSFSLVSDNTGLPSNLTFLVALDENRLRGVQVTDQVYESNDGGITWTNYPINLGDGTFVKRNYHQRGEEFFLASNMSEIYYSAADFNNWESQLAAERIDVEDMIFTDNQTGYLTDEDGGFFKSTDAGATWTELTSFTGIRRRFYTLPNGDLLVTSANLQPVVSSDGGASFSDYLPTSINDTLSQALYRYALLPGGRIYLAASRIAMYSDDGGNNWNTVDLSMLNVTPNNQLYFFDDNLGFFIDSGGGRFARTTDGGLTWTNLTDVSPTSQPLNSIYFSDAQNGIAFNSTRAYRTSDGGDSWVYDSSLPGASDYVISPSRQIITAAFASGNNGTVHLSNDNGENWSNFDYTCAPFRGATITPDGRYFFAFGSGGIVVRYDMDIVNPTRETIQVAKTIEVYPNPVDNILNIKLNDSQVRNGQLWLSDLNGRRILEQNIFAQQAQVQLNVNDIPAGIYLLTIAKEGSTLQTRRVIVK